MDFFHVVAFADKPFKGNPAAVVLLSGELDLCTYSRIASEFNLSETAFVDVSRLPALYVGDKGEDRPFESPTEVLPLRWFTPKVEVALCGHATLATAHVLFTHTNFPHTEVNFTTKSGVLSVRKLGTGLYSMKFPYNEPVPLALDGAPAAILSIVRATVGDVIPEAVSYNCNTKKLIIELQPAHAPLLSTIAPNASKLLSIDQSSNCVPVTGVSVTVQAEPKNIYSADFYSRYFTPWNGIDEDPVNGSSHTILGPYWAAKLHKYKESSVPGMEGIESSTNWRHARLRGVQLSTRSGVLELEVFQEHTASGVGKDSFVMIGGAATTTLQGQVA